MVFPGTYYANFYANFARKWKCTVRSLYDDPVEESWLVFHSNRTCVNCLQADGTAPYCLWSSQLQQLGRSDNPQGLDIVKGISATMYSAGVDTVNNPLTTQSYSKHCIVDMVTTWRFRRGHDTPSTVPAQDSGRNWFCDWLGSTSPVQWSRKTAIPWSFDPGNITVGPIVPGNLAQVYNRWYPIGPLGKFVSLSKVFINGRHFRHSTPLYKRDDL